MVADRFIREAIDIINLQLRAESEIRKQREAQDSCEVYHLTGPAHLGRRVHLQHDLGTDDFLGYFTQSLYEPRRRQSNAEFNAPSTSSTQFHPYSQEHHTTSGMYFALDQVMYQEYDRNSPHYPNFIP